MNQYIKIRLKVLWVIGLEEVIGILHVANMWVFPQILILEADLINPYEEYGIYDFNKLLKQLRFKITDRINYLLNLLVEHYRLQNIE